MTFKELRPNSIVHILDKRDGATYTQGKVLNVGQPRFEMPNNMQAQAPGAIPGMSVPSMVVDVTIEANGKTATYIFAESATTATVDKRVLFATDKESILRELDTTISECEQYIEGIEEKKKLLQQSNDLKSQLDTAYKEKQATENRFKTIEKAQDKLNDKVDKILELLQQKD